MTFLTRWLRPTARRRPTTTPHRRRVRVFTASLLAVVGLATLAACNHNTQSADASQKTQNNISGAVAQEFSQAVPYPFASCDSSGTCTPHAPSDPLELKGLAYRLQQYNSSGDTNYVYVFTFSGTPIGYYVILGKVSSTGSQMTAPQANVGCGASECTNEAVGDDGSYGPEEGGQFGVFFRTSNGTLVETDMPFLVSNHPLAVYANLPELQK